MILIEIPKFYCHLCYTPFTIKFKTKDAVPDINKDVIIVKHDRNVECNQMNYNKEFPITQFIVSSLND